MLSIVSTTQETKGGEQTLDCTAPSVKAEALCSSSQSLGWHPGQLKENLMLICAS